MSITSIALVSEVNMAGITIYDIPTEEISKFTSLLPQGSKKIGDCVFTVSNLLSAEESCDSLYSSRKVKNVEL